MEFATGLLSGGASLLGGILNNSQQQSINQQNNEFNMAMQLQNQQFQAQMSSTAYQRAVNDMKLAGLNPAAMYGGSFGPESSPSGGVVSGQPAQVRDVISPAVEAAIRTIDAMATVEQKKEQNALISAQTGVQVAEQQNKQADTEIKLKEAGLQTLRGPLIQAQTSREIASAREAHGRASTYPAQIDKTMAESERTRADTEYFKRFGKDNLSSPGTWGQMFNHSAKSLGVIKRAVDQYMTERNPEFRNGRIGRPLFASDALRPD